jgi:hypothetical protein
VAEVVNVVGGERPVSQWSRQERLSAAINRSLPLLPGEVRNEVAAMVSPAGLAMMAAIIVVWGVSHFFGVGEIVDVILLITGGVMMGKAALDVANHLIEFVKLINNAESDADLDEAAKHFAEAVVQGGVQVVTVILMWKGGKAAARSGTARRVRPPARMGEITGELNAVPPGRIPASARAAAALIEQGQQPRLASLSEELAQTVRAALNRLRKTDMKVGIDCEGSCQELKGIAKIGEVQEGNATSSIARVDHTMWVVGEEYIDTRPQMWIDQFKAHPEIRAAMEKAVPGLPGRLEKGAILTREEFLRYQGKPNAPASLKFDNKPIPRVRGKE